MHPPRRITQVRHFRDSMHAMSRTAQVTADFGPRLRKLRLERGWTLAQLAEKIGGTVRGVYYYEQEGRYPPVPALVKLAEAFDVSMEWLVSGQEKESLRHGESGPNLLESADDRRLWRRFGALKHLNERDQAAVFRMINGLAAAKEQHDSESA